MIDSENLSKIRSSTCRVKNLIKFLERYNPDASVVMKPNGHAISMVRGIGPLGGLHSLLNDNAPVPDGCVCLYESIKHLEFND